MDPSGDSGFGHGLGGTHGLPPNIGEPPAFSNQTTDNGAGIDADSKSHARIKVRKKVRAAALNTQGHVGDIGRMRIESSPRPAAQTI